MAEEYNNYKEFYDNLATYLISLCFIFLVLRNIMVLQHCPYSMIQSYIVHMLTNLKINSVIIVVFSLLFGVKEAGEGYFIWVKILLTWYMCFLTVRVYWIPIHIFGKIVYNHTMGRCLGQTEDFKITDMSSDAILHLRMANVVYNKPGNRIGTTGIPGFLKKTGWVDVTDKFSKPGSGHDWPARIAVLNRNSQVILSFRGTAVFGDVVDDYRLLFTDLQNDYIKFNTRCKGTYEIVEKVLKQYKNVTVTGHSLGGAIAWYVALRYNLKGHVFNCGAGACGGEVKTPDLIHHHIFGDPISMGNSATAFRKTCIYYNCLLSTVTLSTHSISHWNEALPETEKVKVNIIKVLIFIVILLFLVYYCFF